MGQEEEEGRGEDYEDNDEAKRSTEAPRHMTISEDARKSLYYITEWPFF